SLLVLRLHLPRSSLFPYSTLFRSGFVGEDELSFMRKWQDTGMTAIALSYSNFQWRTPVLAAQKILSGEEVPAEWVLPQDPITQDQLAEYLERNEERSEEHTSELQSRFDLVCRLLLE